MSLVPPVAPPLCWLQPHAHPSAGSPPTHWSVHRRTYDALGQHVGPRPTGDSTTGRLPGALPRVSLTRWTATGRGAPSPANPALFWAFPGHASVGDVGGQEGQDAFPSSVPRRRGGACASAPDGRGPVMGAWPRGLLAVGPSPTGGRFIPLSASVGVALPRELGGGEEG